MEGLASEGKNVPALDRIPSLFPDVAHIWQAFWELNRSRAIGFGIGPIPFSEIAAYVRLFDVENASLFVRAIMSLDAIWLEHEAKKSKAKSKSSSPRSAVPSGRKPRRRYGSRRT